ncbi:hypothetical protein Taro_018255 [Colocasia esculenta]|uniref:Uncharacterized protein n=1 Tax=Colocasia esculenta TaxID=4460 RepID=A0A843UQ92_COLES|nr:hypothetical protein [Colocasia esculenta]
MQQMSFAQALVSFLLPAILAVSVHPPACTDNVVDTTVDVAGEDSAVPLPVVLPPNSPRNPAPLRNAVQEIISSKIAAVISQQVQHRDPMDDAAQAIISPYVAAETSQQECHHEESPRDMKISILGESNMELAVQTDLTSVNLDKSPSNEGGCGLGPKPMSIGITEDSAKSSSESHRPTRTYSYKEALQQSPTGNHWLLFVICNKGDNDMSFLMLLDSLHMGEPTRIENELKNFLKIAYEGKEMRAVADELKVIDLHVPNDKIQDIKLKQQSSTSSSIASVGDACEQVLGRDKTGRVRGIGTGPTAKSLWGSRSEQKLR